MADCIIPEGYKKTSLGVIPKEWEVKRLGDLLLRCANGLTYDVSMTHGISVTRIETISTGKINYQKVGFIPNEIGYENFKMEQGDILYSHINSLSQIGKVAYYNGDKKLYHGMNLLLLRANMYVSQQYLYYVLLTEYMRHMAQIIAKPAVNQASISTGDLKKIRILVPPLEEQQKISEVLSVWDKVIEKQTQLIEKLELRKKGLMQQLLTGKKRLPGFSGEWKKVKAGLLFGSSSIRSNKLEPLLSVTQDKGVVPRDMLETRVTMPNGDLSSFKLVDVGDFVISLRSFEGGLEYSKYRGIVSPAYTVLKKKTDLSDVFYKVYFKSNDFIQRLAVAVIGIRDGKQISYSDFCYIKIPYPSLQEQNAIANVFVSCDDEILLAKQKLNHFQQQKKGLMQVLLTGKKRVTQ